MRSASATDAARPPCSRRLSSYTDGHLAAVKGASRETTAHLVGPVDGSPPCGSSGSRGGESEGRPPGRGPPPGGRGGGGGPQPPPPRPPGRPLPRATPRAPEG